MASEVPLCARRACNQSFHSFRLRTFLFCLSRAAGGAGRDAEGPRGVPIRRWYARDDGTNCGYAILGPLFLLPAHGDVAVSDRSRACIQIRSLFSRLYFALAVSGGLHLCAAACLVAVHRSDLDGPQFREAEAILPSDAGRRASGDKEVRAGFADRIRAGGARWSVRAAPAR